MQAAVLLPMLLAALRGVAGLRLSQDPPVVNAAVDMGVSPPDVTERSQRQVMYNLHDVQYYAYLTIGGQPITGLLDTGSFDLVVFDEACTACGKAAKYSSKQSRSFMAGTHSQSLYYGSGSVDVSEAIDQVALGPYSEVNLTFWNGMSAMMPVLQNAAFNSIVGVGPPETSGSDAWSAVAKDVRFVKQQLETGPTFPDSMGAKRLEDDADLATLLGTSPTLVKANDVAHFSVCLGQKPGSLGYFIWNDTSYLDTPSLFTHVRVLGRHTWTVNMTGLQLSSRAKESGVVSCEGGCGAIVDSGTSLILMPYDAIERLRDALKSMSVDCSNIHSLPEMTFKLDGREFTLPPDAYISKTAAGSDAHADVGTSIYHAERVRLDIGGGECELAVMGSSSWTDWGPLWILGMPFFRSYYTTFKIGRNHDERAIFVTPASRNCTPVGPDSDLARDLGYEQALRTVNRSEILIPRIVHKARTQALLKDL